MCRAKFQINDSIPVDLQLISAWDVPNLRCLPVVRASDDDGICKLTSILMDGAYFRYQASPAPCSQSLAVPSSQLTGGRFQRLAHCIRCLPHACVTDHM